MKKKKKKNTSDYWRERWISYCNASPAQIEVAKDMDFLQFIYCGRFHFLAASEAIYKIIRCKKDKRNNNEEKTWHPSGRSLHKYSQITKKEWGSLYRPARIKRK
ncbi:MAG: hypothetical protein K5842_04705 [Bacteroidales bacterium]|nr:hypothetical protein [Bacteroidales bacterium]